MLFRSPREEIIENKEAIQKKQQRKRLTEEQKKVSKLSFDDEGGMIAGAGTGFGRKAAGLGSAAVSGYVHNKIHQEGDDNAAVEGAHASELAIEEAAKSLRSTQTRMNRTSGRLARKGYRETEDPTGGRLKFGEAEEAVKDIAKEATKKRELNRFWQRKRYKDAYIAARKGKKGADAVTGGTAVTDRKSVV